MKNTVLILLSSKMALVSLLVVGMFLFAPDKAQAQSTTNMANVYVSPPTAISRLETEAKGLKGQLEVLAPGTASFQIVLWKYELYDAVLNHLYLGKTVAQSIELGLNIYATDAYADMPESQKRANRTALIQILHI